MNVLFEFTNNPFIDDLASQYARMALAISMENNVAMVYKSDAIVLSSTPFDIPISGVNFFEQERFLVEQDISMYVDMDDISNSQLVLKDSVTKLDKEQLKELYKNQDIIFRN